MEVEVISGSVPGALSQYFPYCVALKKLFGTNSGLSRKALFGIVLFVSWICFLLIESPFREISKFALPLSAVASSSFPLFFLWDYKSSVLWFHDSAELSNLYGDRRLLIEFGNDAKDMGLHTTRNESKVEQSIEALVEKVGSKVTANDDDYVSLRDTGNGNGNEKEVMQDGNLLRMVEEKKPDFFKKAEFQESGVAKNNQSFEKEHSGVEKLLDVLDESRDGEQINRFKKTITTQEGVLETVARVGGQTFDEDDDVSVYESDEESSVGSVGTDVKDEAPREEMLNVTSDNDSAKVDVTWLDRIVGESDLTRRVESPPEGRKISVVVQPLKNASRQKASEDGVAFKQVEDIPRLIDREDNEYVISNPGKNRMKLQEDFTLISDIIVVIVAAAVGGTLCGFLGQPVILGYLAAGMLVGPGGLHIVHELVQVETLAQFGVVFLLFVLGVEFNPAKMRGVHGVALGGGCLQIGVSMLIGGLLGSSVPQGVFIDDVVCTICMQGAFLSMSSTAVVVKCLVDAKMSSTEQGQIMLGTLILQDCALGLLLAIMPALAAKGTGVTTFVVALSREVMLLFSFCAGAWILAKFFIPGFLRSLVQLTKFNAELYLIGVVGVCLLLALISQCLGLSLEVGAFVGGLILSGGVYTEKILHEVEPIRNVFAALFLASIGMVMNPVFLWQHKDILLASLAVVFLGKTCLFSGVVTAFGYSGKTSLSVGIALAQIGEFAFILLSRAQCLSLVSKKLYLLLMGTSALSLVVTPFAFKIVVRLMTAGGQTAVYRRVTSKPQHSFGVPNVQLKKWHERSDTPEPGYWSLSSSNTVGEVNVIETEQEHLPEPRDVEEGCRDSYAASPAKLVFRRSGQSLAYGKWPEWKKELDEHESNDYSR